MIGRLVPLVMIPRFSSYVGAGDYSTVPLNVEAYKQATLTFWRGPKVGGGASAFSATFEESHDAQVWQQCTISPAGQPITTVNTVTKYTVTLKHRWFRMRVVMTPDVSGITAITCWASGSLEKRIAGVASTG